MTEGQNTLSIYCTHKYTVFPVGYSDSDSDDSVWCCVRYDEAETQRCICATGYRLPVQKNLTFQLIGQWEEGPKYGHSFHVLTFDVCRPSDEAGIVSYLTALKAGIGKRKARSIFHHFQDQIWTILDDDPMRLTEVSGMTQQMVENLLERMKTSKLDRNLFALFSGVSELSSYKLAAIRKTLGHDALGILTEDPYSLCTVKGFSFRTADKLAKKLGFPLDDTNRLAACCREIFRQASMKGHVCFPKDDFRTALQRELTVSWGGSPISEEQIKAFLNDAWKKKKYHYSAGFFYCPEAYSQENVIAERIATLLIHERPESKEIDEEISCFEELKDITLAGKQKEAIRSVFRHAVSIITGGPGTGKSTVINAILHVHRAVFGKRSEPLLLAPTGKAARRMAEITGQDAYTLHAALKVNSWQPQEDEKESNKILRANLVIIDEVSMMDMDITSVLLKRINDNVSVVFIGDPEQLPSVGYGNVLSEFLRSRVIPTTQLDEVFRQSNGSLIVSNAEKIRKGEINLEEGADFRIIEEADTEEVFRRTCQLYISDVQKYGQENVALLCPYRNKSELSVTALNQALQKILNSDGAEKPSIPKGRNSFLYAGDPVMQFRNTERLRNGDLGVVKRIIEAPDPDAPDKLRKEAIISFYGYDGEFPYTTSELQDIDLAYCTTVHKSQGCEHKSVILCVSQQHKALLKRNVIYTAITRAKEKVVVLTERAEDSHSAFERAIQDSRSNHRYTFLAERIRMALQKYSIKQE